MSRSQDTVIDDDEETCPLCIEEFDLSDKNFRPCPCGYQICQFCFNSLKTTYEKSTCPNCRRPYDEATIQYKIPTAEEFKLDLMNKNKKQAAVKRKETEKREVETSARRNLAGVRVKQQNLVYVIGLEPTKKDESVLLETLRGKEFFGQYGDIEKIVVSKAKPGATNQGIGVYVTFKRKEDAATCIDSVDGSVNGERILRAQYGTTKYCSAFLRGETCMNKNCSFLHETGEDGHHTSLQNEPSEPRNTSRPPFTSTASNTGRILPHLQHAISSQPMARQDSKDTDDSRKGSYDGSALPPSAGWANTNAPIARARRASQVASRGTPSPRLSHGTPSIPKTETVKPAEFESNSSSNVVSKPISKSPPPSQPVKTEVVASPASPMSVDSFFEQIKKSLTADSVAFIYDDSFLGAEERARIADMPPLYDPYGGAKRRMMEEKELAERARLESDAKDKLEAQATSTAEEALDEDNMAAGSLALGGEPEDSISTSARIAIHRPAQNDQFSSLRSFTPQQAGNMPRAPGLPQPPAQNTAIELSDFERRGNQYSQAQYDQISNHQRNGSRYFNNESKTGVGNTRFQGTQQQAFYSSGVQGPPPGLPTAGTPPVSGGGMFAHGQGFTNTGFGTNKENNTDIFRGRTGTNTSHDIPKRGGVEHLADPSILQARVHQGGGTPGQGLFGGTQADDSISTFPTRLGFQSAEIHSRVSSLQSLQGLRSSTPKIPPGFESSIPNAPPIDDVSTEPSTLAQNTTATTTTVIPAVPLAIGQPVKVSNSKPELPKHIEIDGRAKSGENAEVASKVSSPTEFPTLPASSAVKIPSTTTPAKTKELKSLSQRQESKSESQAVNEQQEVDLSAADVQQNKTSTAKANVVSLPDVPATIATPIEPVREFARAPRTLRLTTSTIKPLETLISASPDVEKSAVISALSQTKYEHSRQPSVSSLSRSRPSTPSASDRLVSRDVSRAGSPRPSSIVGSAPARMKTKAQAKKDRKDKKKVDLVESTSATTIAPTPPDENVAPIIARQKKQKKKSSTVSETNVATKAKDTRESKSAVEEEDEVQDVSIVEDVTPPAKVSEQKPTPETKTNLPKASMSSNIAKSPYAVRDLCNDAAKAGDDTIAIQKLLGENLSPMGKLIGEMISSGDLSRNHPWLTNPSFTSAAYKLPSDTRKGQDYLDANGYSGNDAFGYVYLPQKEKRALYAGHAVSVADTGDRKHDLLRRCLISPNGWVMRHLSVEESERVLELEERRSMYADEFGELGHMNDLGPLEEDDFINLGGGIEELGRYGNRHGVCWVTSDDRREGDDVYDELDDEMLGADEMSEMTDEDLGLDLPTGSTRMPGEWDPAFNTNVSDATTANTLPPMQGRSGKTVNLRGMDIDGLQVRIKEKQREADTFRKEADKAEKLLARKTKEMAKWKEVLLKA